MAPTGTGTLNVFRCLDSFVPVDMWTECYPNVNSSFFSPQTSLISLFLLGLNQQSWSVVKLHPPISSFQSASPNCFHQSLLFLLHQSHLPLFHHLPPRSPCQRPINLLACFPSPAESFVCTKWTAGGNGAHQIRKHLSYRPLASLWQVKRRRRGWRERHTYGILRSVEG